MSENTARWFRTGIVAIVMFLVWHFAGPNISLALALSMGFLVYILLTNYIEDHLQGMIMGLANGQVTMRQEMDALQRRLGEVPVSDTLGKDE